MSRGKANSVVSSLFCHAPLVYRLRSVSYQYGPMPSELCHRALGLMACCNATVPGVSASVSWNWCLDSFGVLTLDKLPITYLVSGCHWSQNSWLMNLGRSAMPSTSYNVFQL